MTVERSAEKPFVFLIIDDDPIIIRLISLVLKSDGKVLFATNGADGLALARDHRPDLILLDAEMPGMTGFEVCAALRGAPATADIPVIFVTGHSDSSHEIRALGVGAVDFISKPIHPPIVRLRVQTHLTIKRQADALRRLSQTDGLTGVLNRRAFDDILAAEWIRAQRARTPLGLLMIDLDCFKAYNDHYGHSAGDGCLKSVVGALATVVRNPPDSLARFGGEEFVCLLPGADIDGAVTVGRRVLTEVRGLGLRHDYSDAADHVTISIGAAAMSPEPEQGAEVLIEAADCRLYQAKEAGRNQLVFA